MRLAQVAVYDQKKAAYLGDKILESSNFGAGGENRTPISSLENLHTSRCTTPAVCPIVAER